MRPGAKVTMTGEGAVFKRKILTPEEWARQIARLQSWQSEWSEVTPGEIAHLDQVETHARNTIRVMSDLLATQEQKVVTETSVPISPMNGRITPVGLHVAMAIMDDRVKQCEHISQWFQRGNPIIVNVSWDTDKLPVLCGWCATAMSALWDALYGDTPENHTCDMCREVQPSTKDMNMIHVAFGAFVIIAGLCNRCLEAEGDPAGDTDTNPVAEPTELI